MFANVNVGFVGGGNMGEALIRGLLAASLLQADQIQVVDVSQPRLDYLRQNYAICISPGLSSLAKGCQVIILAVKPQNIAEVINALRPELSHRPLVISIAAGISLAMLSASLPDRQPVIRVMPNTPALVLQGISALARGAHASEKDLQLAMALFGAVGKAVQVEEKWMDAVTGLSGSGPAYILLLLEALIDAGVLVGLPRSIARELVLQTAAGTVAMTMESGKHHAELKDLITSPGGTTFHGLQILERTGVRGALMDAVEAATLRSRKLGESAK
jgi:pyrroline-5-carboxylate reductase